MLASPYDGCFKVSKDKNTLADGLIETTSTMLDDIESKFVHTVSEVKSVENISKNSQFSSDKSCAKGSPSFT